MKSSGKRFLVHLSVAAALLALLVLCILYPYLAGRYDPLSVTLSALAQLVGIVGIPLSLVGLLWVVIPEGRVIFMVTAIAICVLVSLVLTLFALLSSGYVLGVIIALFGASLFIRLLYRFRQLKNDTSSSPDYMPVYLISLPLVLLIFQLTLAQPVRNWSRGRAMKNACEIIKDIEAYRQQYGNYPVSLQAQYEDYSTGIVGIEKYHYLPHGDSYNLSFEQPRFLLDRFGTREWVVYNPRDEHRVYSHAAWFLLLSPQQLETSQGWYASGRTSEQHWKYFLFD